MVRAIHHPDTHIATYEFDGAKRRIVETVEGTPDVVYDHYYNSGWQLLEVRKDGDVDPLKQFVWDLRYIDSPVVHFHDSDTDGTLDNTLYYTTDAYFNVTAVIDNTGVVIERYAYDSYGKVMILDADWSEDADGVSDVDNRTLFTGYHYDSETGLYLARHRIYHPTLGRFIQRDPLGYVDGMSTYASYFVMWGGVDPDGRETWATKDTFRSELEARWVTDLDRKLGDKFGVVERPKKWTIDVRIRDAYTTEEVLGKGGKTPSKDQLAKLYCTKLVVKELEAYIWGWYGVSSISVGLNPDGTPKGNPEDPIQIPSDSLNPPIPMPSIPGFPKLGPDIRELNKTSITHEERHIAIYRSHWSRVVGAANMIDGRIFSTKDEAGDWKQAIIYYSWFQQEAAIVDNIQFDIDSYGKITRDKKSLQIGAQLNQKLSVAKGRMAESFSTYITQVNKSIRKYGLDAFKGSMGRFP